MRCLEGQACKLYYVCPNIAVSLTTSYTVSMSKVRVFRCAEEEARQREVEAARLAATEAERRRLEAERARLEAEKAALEVGRYRCYSVERLPRLQLL